MSVEAFLEKWQSAVLGGLFALAVALVVARDARHRAERTAAMMMIRHLVELIGLWNNARRIDDRRRRANFIAENFPRLPHDYASIFAVLSSIHVHVAGHLHAVEYMSRGMTRMLAVHADVIGQWRSMYGGRVGADPELDRTIERNDELASDWSNALANHSACAVRLLELLALSRMPTWHRLRVAATSRGIEAICRNAIQNGSFGESAFEAGGWARNTEQQ